MTARHKVSVADFGVVVAKLPARVKARIVRGLRSAAHLGVGLVVEEIDNAQPFAAVDRGELRSSVNTERLDDGAVLFVDAPHAIIIELGTRPFTPPLAPLVAWVKRKKPEWITEYIQAHEVHYSQAFRSEYGRHAQRLTNTAKNKDRALGNVYEDDAAKQIARAIQRKIARDGIAPRHFFRKAMTRLRPVIETEVRRELNTPVLRNE